MVGARPILVESVRQHVLVVTRACSSRCAYCPTSREGWPELSPEDARRAIGLFAERYGGGDVKLFGGEPLANPDAVLAALDAAAGEPRIRRVQLSTNGLWLDAGWIGRFRDLPGGVIALSLDGRPEDHRRLRRGPDAYAHVVELLPELLRARVVVTQTIAPETADRAAANFRHLLGLGFWRVNLLPVYLVEWSARQLTALRANLSEIEAEIRGRYEAGKRLYLRNVYSRAITPLFNAGPVVDCDGSILASNLGMAAPLEHLRHRTVAGTLDAPPDAERIEALAARTPALLAEGLDERVLASTRAVDEALSALCDHLLPALLRARGRA